MRASLRGRLTLFTVLGAAVTLAALTLGFNLVLRASLDSDANSLLRARAQTTLQSLDVEPGRVTVAEPPGDGAPGALAWVFAGRRTLASPPSLRSLDLLARSLAAGTRTFAEDDATDTRLYAAPISSDARRLGTVVSGVSLEPYERNAKRALVASLIFSGVILALVIAASRIVISRALRPVARMTEEATDWSEHDLDHRFNAGEPHDELTRLAATFDGMLDLLAAALRHEQRFSAELSHELRTPLAAILTEAELGLRRDRTPPEYREALKRISWRSHQLEETLETLLLAAREEVEPGSWTDAGEAVERSLESFAALAAEHRVDLGSKLPQAPVVVAAGSATVERILAPLLENACLYARARVEVELAAEHGAARLVITDDGPGVRPGEHESIFSPGNRGTGDRERERRDGAGGTGLGLALARRLARAVGGEVRALDANAGGAFEVTLPAFR